MIAITSTKAPNRFVERIIDLARVRRHRSIAQFAFEEISLPHGPHQGARLTPDVQPWLVHWLGQIDSGLWRRFALTGPGQAGKSLGGLVLPLVHCLFERSETAILAAPSLDIAMDKLRQDVFPFVIASKYRDLMPSGGRGSRGGTVNSITFKNGATLRLMSGSGDDKSRASFTARTAVITEVDGMDQPSGTSRESDPISQVEARTAAFGDAAAIFLECTVSVATGRIWRELKGGSDSSLVLRCPHCLMWVAPEREHLTGWQNAPDVLAARDGAGLACPRCGTVWNEQHRIAANQNARLVHGGQRIDDQGAIVGDVPRTITFSFRFSGVHNLLKPLKNLAEQEWSAPKTNDPETVEKALKQFTWVVPVESDARALTITDHTRITSRMAEWGKGILPPGTTAITTGVDMGLHLAHWVALAWRCGTPHVLDYNRVEVPSASMSAELAVMNALRRFRDEVVRVGWQTAEGAKIVPVANIVDAGYMPDAVVQFTRESGGGNGKWWPAKGIGLRNFSRREMFEDGFAPVPMGDYFLIEHSSDFWKSYIHARLQTPLNEPGALTLFSTTAQNHFSFAKHLTAEQKVEEYMPGKGLMTRWECVNENNHFLDALALACLAGVAQGEKLLTASTAAPTPKPAAPVRDTSQRVSVRQWASGGRRW